MGLATKLPAWVAGLIMAGITLIAAAVAIAVGWGKRVRAPLAKTRRTLKEDIRWVKERLA